MPDLVRIETKLDNMKEDLDELKIDVKAMSNLVMTEAHCREIQGRCQERLDEKASRVEVAALKRLLWIIAATVFAAVGQELIKWRGGS